MKPEILEVKLNRYQREFLWQTLEDERWKDLNLSAQELSDTYKAIIEGYIKSLPEYELLEKYTKCFNHVSRIDLPIQTIDNVIDRISSCYNNPAWSFPSRYEIIHDLKYRLDTYAVFSPGLPAIHNLKFLDSEYLNVFSESEILILETKLESIILKLVELHNLFREYNSDAGNKFGKIATWGELKRINPDWFDIVYNRYADTVEVKSETMAIEEAARVKKGKSVILNETLASLRELAKRCNLIK